MPRATKIEHLRARSAWELRRDIARAVRWIEREPELARRNVQILFMHEVEGWSMCELALEYGVSQARINYIVQRQRTLRALFAMRGTILR